MMLVSHEIAEKMIAQVQDFIKEHKHSCVTYNP